MSTYEPDFLLFASDAELLCYWGLGFILLAVMALLLDRRRVKRSELDRVGWIPWTGLFLVSAVIGGGMVMMALPSLMAG